MKSLHSCLLSDKHIYHVNVKTPRAQSCHAKHERPNDLIQLSVFFIFEAALLWKKRLDSLSFQIVIEVVHQLYIFEY